MFFSASTSEVGSIRSFLFCKLFFKGCLVELTSLFIYLFFKIEATCLQVSYFGRSSWYQTCNPRQAAGGYLGLPWPGVSVTQGEGTSYCQMTWCGGEFVPHLQGHLGLSSFKNEQGARQSGFKYILSTHLQCASFGWYRSQALTSASMSSSVKWA